MLSSAVAIAGAPLIGCDGSALEPGAPEASVRAAPHPAPAKLSPSAGPNAASPPASPVDPSAAAIAQPAVSRDRLYRLDDAGWVALLRDPNAPAEALLLAARSAIDTLRKPAEQHPRFHEALAHAEAGRFLPGEPLLDALTSGLNLCDGAHEGFVEETDGRSHVCFESNGSDLVVRVQNVTLVLEERECDQPTAPQRRCFGHVVFRATAQCKTLDESTHASTERCSIEVRFGTVRQRAEGKFASGD